MTARVKTMRRRAWRRELHFEDLDSINAGVGSQSRLRVRKKTCEMRACQDAIEQMREELRKRAGLADQRGEYLTSQQGRLHPHFGNQPALGVVGRIEELLRPPAVRPSPGHYCTHPKCGSSGSGALFPTSADVTDSS